VQQGECIASIAFDNGFFPDTLWQLPENQQLRELRKDLHVLLPGDTVIIPDLRPRTETCATDKTHKFRRFGVPDMLSLRFLEGGEPRVGVPWELKVDDAVFQGKTDGGGFVRHSLLPNAKKATLTLKPEGKQEEQYQVQLRHVDPVTQISGQQARLRNLGLFSGDVDGVASPAFQDAVRAFQLARGMDATGEMDEAAGTALQTAHGS
jgi:hypothetical protein